MAVPWSVWERCFRVYCYQCPPSSECFRSGRFGVEESIPFQKALFCENPMMGEMESKYLTKRLGPQT